MNPKYLYLAVNFLTVIFPLLFSFYPKANFSRKWKYLWISTLVPGIIFVAWDILFTRLGIWGFNSSYLSGVYIGNLPIEEILFFICIPYACVFTYEALNYLVRKNYFESQDKVITVIITIGCLTAGILNIGKLYTSTTFLALGAYLIILQFVCRVRYLARVYFSYLFILVPFFIVNGILTGSWIDDPVVWYNDTENLGIRMGTIPAEDTFYGFFLILMNVSIFEWLQDRVQVSTQTKDIL